LTFFNSALDSLRNVKIFFKPYSFRDVKQPVLFGFLADCFLSFSGQAGFEPATSGFGDRRSTSWSYWPIVYRFSRFLRHAYNRKMQHSSHLPATRMRPCVCHAVT
jgi:hypothetical protein